MEYILGIRFKPCSDGTSEYCLHRKVHKTCEKAVNVCHAPIINNPLCLCKSSNECPGYFNIIRYKDDIYILYQCNKCKYLVKNYKDMIKKIFLPLESKYLYFDKDLEILCNKILPKNDVDDDFKSTVKFFAHAFKLIETGV